MGPHQDRDKGEEVKDAVNDVVRKFFAESGVTYNQCFDNIEILKECVNKELIKLDERGGLKMTLSKKKVKFRLKKDSRDIDCFFLRVDGPYFKDREAISFNVDGFVGFAGWASTDNTFPFIEGFCDFIRGLKPATFPPHDNDGQTV
jgi:hypothetical protein